jgi:hypothetical protein
MTGNGSRAAGVRHRRKPAQEVGAEMSSFERKNEIVVPQDSPWHLVTGSFVLTFGSVGGFYLLGWLLFV